MARTAARRVRWVPRLAADRTVAPSAAIVVRAARASRKRVAASAVLMRAGLEATVQRVSLFRVRVLAVRVLTLRVPAFEVPAFEVPAVGTRAARRTKVARVRTPAVVPGSGATSNPA